MKTILIAGATGLIGTHLIKTLANTYKFILITRDKNNAKSTKKNSVIISWKEFNTQNSKWIEEADIVINLAGESILKPFTKRNKQKIYDSRIQSTKYLVRAIQNTTKKPSCFINASAIGYYDHSIANKTYTEADRAGKGFLSKLCQDWEHEARKASIRTIQLRIGLVLDSKKGFLKTMLILFNTYMGGFLGNGKQACPWIHIEDVTNSIKFIIETNQISGPVNLVSPKICDLKTFCNILSHITKRPSWCHPPAFIIRLLFGELAASLLKTPFVKPEKLLLNKYQFIHEDLEKTLENILK